MGTPLAQVDVCDVPDPLPANLVVLDVRELDEWEAGHIADAIHVPLQQVPERLSDIPADRPVMVVCRVGARSAYATAFLRAAGRDAVNLGGGLLAWDSGGRQLVSESGSPPTVA